MGVDGNGRGGGGSTGGFVSGRVRAVQERGKRVRSGEGLGCVVRPGTRIAGGQGVKWVGAQWERNSRIPGAWGEGAVRWVRRGRDIGGGGKRWEKRRAQIFERSGARGDENSFPTRVPSLKGDSFNSSSESYRRQIERRLETGLQRGGFYTGVRNLPLGRN